MDNRRKTTYVPKGLAFTKRRMTVLNKWDRPDFRVEPKVDPPPQTPKALAPFVIPKIISAEKEVTCIQGIGPAASKAMAKHGFLNAGDLIRVYKKIGGHEEDFLAWMADYCRTDRAIMAYKAIRDHVNGGT